MERNPAISGCLDEASAKDRHCNAVQPQVEENPRGLEEASAEGLTHVLPWDPAEHALNLDKVHGWATQEEQRIINLIRSCPNLSLRKLSCLSALMIL
jgi:hypothetical protein